MFWAKKTACRKHRAGLKGLPGSRPKRLSAWPRNMPQPNLRRSWTAFPGALGLWGAIQPRSSHTGGHDRQYGHSGGGGGCGAMPGADLNRPLFMLNGAHTIMAGGKNPVDLASPYRKDSIEFQWGKRKADIQYALSRALLLWGGQPPHF